MADSRTMSAREAADALGVTVATVYAYVSRGLLRSQPAPGSNRARRYLRADVDALLARRAVRRDPAQAAAQALHFGTPVLSSGITLIEDGRLYYRGVEVGDLLPDWEFIQVARLLWGGEASAAPLPPLPAELRAPLNRLLPLLREQPPIVRMQAGLAYLAPADLAAYDLRPAAVRAAGERLLPLLAILCGGDGQVTESRAPLPRRLAQSFGVDATAAGLLRQALILVADHELNVSAFSARVIASAGATPYGVVGGGLAALQGRKHGGMTARVAAFLEELRAADSARQAVAARLQRGENVPGFGHPLYPNGDPRGRALLEAAERYDSRHPLLPRIADLRQTMAQTTQPWPTIDLGLVVMTEVLGLPPGTALGVFALGRAAGWIAHALEQYAADELIRPRAQYVGSRPGGENA